MMSTVQQNCSGANFRNDVIIISALQCVFQFVLHLTALEKNTRAEDQIFRNDFNCCRTALKQNHCTGVKFRNDVHAFSIAVDVAVSIALHYNCIATQLQLFGTVSNRDSLFREQNTKPGSFQDQTVQCNKESSKTLLNSSKILPQGGSQNLA